MQDVQTKVSFKFRQTLVDRFCCCSRGWVDKVRLWAVIVDVQVARCIILI